MTAHTTLASIRPETQLRRTAVLSWLELPRVVAVGVVWIVVASPMVTGLLGAPWPLVVLGALPSCLYATGLARFAAIVSRGERPRVRDAFRLDLQLGCTIELGVVTSAVLLVGGGPLMLPGVLLTAVLLLVTPFAVSYGAVRGRSGFAAWRGAFTLVAYRPGTALTVLAVNCIAGFVVIASLGTLAVFIPCNMLVFTCAIVAGELDDIDHRLGLQ